MITKDFIRLGIPRGAATRRTTDFVSQFILNGGDKTKLLAFFVENPLRKESAKVIANAPPPPRAEPVNYSQKAQVHLVPPGATPARSLRPPVRQHALWPDVQQIQKISGEVTFHRASDRRRGAGGDFRRKLLNLALQPAHFLQRTFRENRELLRLSREQLAAQGGQRLTHPLQLLDRLGQNRFRFVHNTARSSHLRVPGASRTRLKNSIYVLYSLAGNRAARQDHPHGHWSGFLIKTPSR